MTPHEITEHPVKQCRHCGALDLGDKFEFKLANCRKEFTHDWENKTMRRIQLKLTRGYHQTSEDMKYCVSEK